MIEIVKFEKEHWLNIDEQDATAHLRPFCPDIAFDVLIEADHSYTALSNGRILVCAGVVPVWEGRAEAWAVLAKVCRREFLGIHNATKRFLDVCPFDRVEITVDCEFEDAHRWARLLGFEMEAPVMRKYSPDGKDYALYARVR